MIAVLDDLKIESAHLFGYSLGGWVALELMARTPGRVSSAIVAGAHPYAEDLSQLRTAFTPAAILAAWDALHAPLSQASVERLAAFDPKRLAEMVPPDPIDQAEQLDDLPMPLLTIRGTHDRRFEGMRRFAPKRGREFVAIEGADHLQTWLRSADVLPPLQSFLRAARRAD